MQSLGIGYVDETTSDPDGPWFGGMRVCTYCLPVRRECEAWYACLWTGLARPGGGGAHEGKWDVGSHLEGTGK